MSAVTTRSVDAYCDLMSITQFPLIAETPSLAKAKSGLLFTVFFLIAVLGMYFFSGNTFNQTWFGIFTLLMMAHAVATLRWFNGNLIIFFRYFLLFVPIFITAVAWYIWGGKVYTAPYGFEYQTQKTTALLVTAGFLTLLGATAGWLWAFRRFGVSTSVLYSNIFRFRKLLLKTGIVLVCFITALFAIQNGSFLGFAAYQSAEAEGGLQLEFHVFNIFHFSGIACLMLLSVIPQVNHKKILGLAAFTLVIGLLKGNRADFLPQLVILLVFIVVVSRLKRDMNQGKIPSTSLAKPIFIFLLLGLAGFFLGHIIAILRYNPAMSFFDAASQVFSLGTNVLINETYGSPLLWIETGNMMIGGIYAMIIKVENEFGGFLLGSSYVNWILTLPPAFLGLDRPEGLEWKTDISGEVMTQGGIFEVAEAYVNFGLPGCFFVSFFISWFMGRLLRSALVYGNIIFMLWYLTMGLFGLRAIWYQNFGYFRTASIYLMVWAVVRVFKPGLLGVRKLKQPALIVPDKALGTT